MILITGATGNIGRNVVAQLHGEGRAVRTLSRNPDKAEILPSDIELVQGDLYAPDTLTAALTGITEVFLFPVPGAGPGFTEVARAHGVRRIVLLSSGAIRDDLSSQRDAIAEFHSDIERAVQDSGIEWTFIRPGSLAVNALQWAPQIKGGTVFGPYANAIAAPVHEKDVAAVAVRALTSDEYLGSKLAVTGPEGLSQADQVRIIGTKIGREIQFTEVPPDAARGQMVNYMPEPVADAVLAGLGRSVGQPATILDTVEQVTGRAARSFPEWVDDHIAEFRG